jgi:predicted histidine transporter YuiF (NhaC family)
MRKLILVAMIALVGFLPVMVSSTSYAQAPTQAQTDVKSDHRLLAAGAGAVFGIVLFNMLTYSFGSVPFVTAALAPTPVDIALGSRVVAAITAGGGALAAHYLYSAFSK